MGEADATLNDLELQSVDSAEDAAQGGSVVEAPVLVLRDEPQEIQTDILHYFSESCRNLPGVLRKNTGFNISAK